MMSGTHAMRHPSLAFPLAVCQDCVTRLEQRIDWLNPRGYLMKNTRLVMTLLGVPAVAVALAGCCTAGMEEMAAQMDANAASIGSRISSLESRIGDMEAAQRQTAAEVERASMTAERAAEASEDAKATSDATSERMDRMFEQTQQK